MSAEALEVITRRVPPPNPVTGKGTMAEQTVRPSFLSVIVAPLFDLSNRLSGPLAITVVALSIVICATSTRKNQLTNSMTPVPNDNNHGGSTTLTVPPQVKEFAHYTSKPKQKSGCFTGGVPPLYIEQNTPSPIYGAMCLGNGWWELNGATWYQAPPAGK